MRNLLPPVGLTLLLCILPGAFVHAEDTAAAGKVQHSWYRLHINGAYSGHIHRRVRTVEQDGRTHIETRETTDMKMKRMGSIIEVHSVSESWEKPLGSIMRIETVAKMSANTTKTTFTFTDGKVKIDTVTMGRTRSVETPIDKDLVGPAFVGRAVKTLAGTKGEKVVTKTYMSDYQRAVTTTMTSHGEETVELPDGRKLELTRFTGVVEGLPAIRPTVWIDAEGRDVKTSLKMAGLLFETFAVKSRAEALAVDSTAQPIPDVFTETFVREADPIPVPRHLEQASITLKRRDDTLPFPKFVAEGLRVSDGEDGMLLIEARRVVPPADKQGARPLAVVPDALNDALAASSMIQCDEVAILKTAQTVVGGEKSAWKAAQTLERWVFENMTKKNMSVAFGSALEAFESREGDCTEHAVLLAALCRAAGIPARVVMGLEFLFGIWGGHAWNDVWIDGAWYQLDGTNGYGYVDPLHLPMAHMVMKEGGQSEFAEIIGGIGNLDVDIVSVVRGGRTIRVNDSATLITSKAGRYRDLIWSLQFDAPEGFSIGAPKRGPGLSAMLIELGGKTADGKAVGIQVDAMDAAPGGIDATLRQMGLDPSMAEKGDIDGRTSRTMTLTRNGQTVMRTGVVSDGALFIFRLSRADDEAERKAFTAFLDSVDLDLK